MAMFPDSGVPPADAKNSLPDVNTAGCDELWYSTARCQPRFDPAAANAMLAEDMNLIMRGEVVYDCHNLDHIERAVRYINQRGLPRGVALKSGPFNYHGTLDPPITRHNDLMTLTIIPSMDNQGAVRLDFGIGEVPLLRNDGQQLKSKDILLGRPLIIVYWAGNWFCVGLVSSQVPLVVVGGIDAWIRTDGNDITGDGTANSPDKAFRTIQGCWQAVGSRYAASPLFSINMRLGIPGNYDGASMGPFGGNVSLTGDPANPTAYRIMSVLSGTVVFSLLLSGISNFSLTGVNLVMNNGGSYANGNWCLRWSMGSVVLDRVHMTLEASSPSCGIMTMLTSGGLLFMNGSTIVIEGNGNSCQTGLSMMLAAASYGCPPGGPQCSVVWRNIRFNIAGHTVSDQAVLRLGNLIYSNSNTTGSYYSVTSNGVFDRGGQTLPGNAPGTVGSQGQVF